MANKDPKCLDMIYERYGGIMFTMISRMVKPKEQAEDVLQETMVKIWKNLDRFDPSKAKLITWMIQIAKNQSLDYLKSKMAKKTKVTDSVDVREEVGLVPMTTVDKDLIDVKDIVDESVDARDRKILDMLYFQGYTQKEVSENLDIPLGSVKTRVRITLKQLRSVFNYG
jgi:RNA polymerase sigma-70 factor (ECF subfamily)